MKEIKIKDIFNDNKHKAVKETIHLHKVLKDLTLTAPDHLIIKIDGYGVTDSYKLTEKGVQYIIEQLNKNKTA